MSRRKRPQPEHGSPHEQHLRDIVDELVQEESQKAAYLAFAHELAAAERSSSFVHRSSSVIPRERRDSRNLAAKQAGRDPSLDIGVTNGRDPSFLLGMTDGRDPSIGVGVTETTMRQRRSPDFSIGTKRVIAKWVARGLTQSVLQAIRTDVFNVAAPVVP